MGMRRFTMFLTQHWFWLLVMFFFLVATVSVSATEAQNYIVHLSRHRGDKDGILFSHQGYLEAVLGRNGGCSLSGSESHDIWPESASFSDKGLGPIPARWKGKCVKGQKFTTANCNKKLIGARYYSAGNPKIQFTQEYNSSRDYQGHGTHVASTAAGAYSPANFYGYANGTAKGGAPRARIAVYKVCWFKTLCYYADIVAAMEDAITDGVDLINISLHGSNDMPFFRDTVGIASFHAMKKGILVNFCAGNHGPGIRTVNHVEPWSFTVAATTQDRFLGADVVVKPNGSPQPGLNFRISSYTAWSLYVEKIQSLRGISQHKKISGLTKSFVMLEAITTLYRAGATSSKSAATTAPMVLASEVANGVKDAAFCFAGTLDLKKVKGKIVFCLRGRKDEPISSKVEAVFAAGGVGMIVGNTEGLEDYTIEITTSLRIPAVHVSADDSKRIVDYFTECDYQVCTVRGETEILPINTTMTIFRGTTFFGVKPAPVIADFSSCGPSGVTTDILKPDIAAPGVNILGAWIDEDNAYHQMSGTSMATPHISGVVALLKAVHPKWSPAAIKSAIMTTAKEVDNTKNLIKNLHKKAAGAFSTGSGLVDPVAAVDPGLIYEADWRDYTLFLCSLKYSDRQIEIITGEKGFCTKKAIPSSSNLNYPSVSIGDLTTTVDIKRTVTNVGRAQSDYFVFVEAPQGVKVTISLSILSFSKSGDIKSFTIHLERAQHVSTQESYVFGSFTWSDGVHKVRSPIVVGSKPRYTFQEDVLVDRALISLY